MNDPSQDVTQKIPRLTHRSAVESPTPMSHADRVKLFGAVRFTHYPMPGNPEHISIAEPWERQNIVRVTLPACEAFPARAARVHRLVAPQFTALWKAWLDAGLLPLVLTFNGAWSPRFKRQIGTEEERVARCKSLPQRALSNHAFGSAFDLNTPWNRLGDEPAPIGHRGSVYELVPLAIEHGFSWGGHYARRKDGMHFELCRLL